MTTSPLVLRGRDGTAQLDGGALRLEQEAIRRIPLEAVEEIRAAENGLTLEIVLTTVSGPATVYRLRCRSGPAVAAFVDMVAALVPERVPGEPRRDGAALVLTEARPPRRRPAYGLWAFLGVCLASGGVAIGWGSAGNVLFFFLGWFPLFIGYAISDSVGRDMYLTWALRRSGLTVLATRHPSNYRIFQFTDASGVVRDFRGHADWVSGSNPPQVQVLYDPHRSDRMVGVQMRANWVLNWLYLVFGLPILVLGLVAVPGQFVLVLFN
ncbi:hypothetical protein ACIQNU_38855 [Streptomyces sp. NPDC091292]|uniref:hypothetical protein n=1 Tax=Streptomyces sp. NPDC091292 TaxID=3365991 RepID=UPI0037F85211